MRVTVAFDKKVSVKRKKRRDECGDRVQDVKVGG